MAKEKKQVSEDVFELDGKQYKVVLHAVIIPEMGVRTKAEILFDEAAQKYLVEVGSSAVQEIV
ncbi:MAG: hypothetical protein EOO14_11925 [Chitinophagaceae bacterium]|nr:MAG: hypothetical protein EOO14_11925 [Chitinophagaceae bacterium]